MAISPAGLKLIEGFEGFRELQYKDSVGVPTIGFGTTAAVLKPLPERCTAAQAEEWLRLAISRDVEPALEEAIKSAPRKPNPHQYDALCSLGYNLGAGVFSSSYRIGGHLREGNLEAVSQDFLVYVYAGGHVLQGLVNRRKAEQALFNKPYVAPYPYERYDATPRNILGNDRWFNEREVAKEYDAKIKHPKVYAKRLRVLKHVCAAFADRLVEVEKVDPGHNAELFRPWRRAELYRRSLGK